MKTYKLLLGLSLVAGVTASYAQDKEEETKVVKTVWSDVASIESGTFRGLPYKVGETEEGKWFVDENNNGKNDASELVALVKKYGLEDKDGGKSIDLYLSNKDRCVVSYGRHNMGGTIKTNTLGIGTFSEKNQYKILIMDKKYDGIISPEGLTVDGIFFVTEKEKVFHYANGKDNFGTFSPKALWAAVIGDALKQANKAVEEHKKSLETKAKKNSEEKVEKKSEKKTEDKK